MPCIRLPGHTPPFNIIGSAVFAGKDADRSGTRTRGPEMDTGIFYIIPSPDDATTLVQHPGC